VAVAGTRRSHPQRTRRTSVIGPDGGRGVHFHSLDIPALPPTLVARLGFRLPYCTATMRIARRGDRVGSIARRRWPAAQGRDGAASSRVVVRVGEPVAPDALTALDVLLSAQWALYAAGPGGSILEVEVRHEPWRLREAHRDASADPEPV